MSAVKTIRKIEEMSAVEIAKMVEELEHSLTVERERADEHVADCKAAEDRLEKILELRPVEEWHEDIQCEILLWHLPVCEPPIMCRPCDDEYDEGWHTHFSLVPEVWNGKSYQDIVEGIEQEDTSPLPEDFDLSDLDDINDDCPF